MKQDPILGFLGLAARSGNVVSGEFSVEKAVKGHKARLVIVAEDASDNTRKNFTDMCSYYNTELRIYGTKDLMGHALGKQYRASCAVTDPGMAKTLRTKMDAKMNLTTE